MKKQCKPVSRGRWLALLLSALLLLGMLPASGIAAQTEPGTLTVKLKADTYGQIKANSAPEVTLYRIGKADDTSPSGWSIDAAFQSYDILAAKKSEDLGKIAKKIAKDIGGKGVSGTKKPMTNGQAVFDNLVSGVYFGMVTGVPAEVEVTPFIVTIPSIDPVSGKPIYQYEVTLKDEWVTSATVKKVWMDEDDTYGIRPKYITVTLSNGTQVTLSAANNWEATVSDLPKYDQGREIQYTWSEPKVNGYELASVSKSGNVTTLTNVFVPTETPTATPQPTPTPNTQLSGQKIWVDDSNAHKTRPDAITVTLYADGVATKATPTWTNTNTDVWTYTFANLPAVDANGQAIEYTVKETVVEGYESEVKGTTITNKLIPRESKEFKELTGHKTWQEIGSTEAQTAAANRPTHIVVHLLRDGVEVETRTVTAATNWDYSFGKQPVDDGYGNIYTYTIREDGVPGFFTRIDGLNLINITLTPEPPTQRRGDTPKRGTNTQQPPFEKLTEEKMDELVDILDYKTPLWGQLLGTGDKTPVYPYVFGGIGVAAIVALLVIFGRKRKKKEK